MIIVYKYTSGVWYAISRRCGCATLSSTLIVSSVRLLLVDTVFSVNLIDIVNTNTCLLVYNKYDNIAKYT